MAERGWRRSIKELFRDGGLAWCEFRAALLKRSKARQQLTSHRHARHCQKDPLESQKGLMDMVGMMEDKILNLKEVPMKVVEARKPGDTFDTVNINREQEDESTWFLEPWVLVHCWKVLVEGISCTCGYALEEGISSTEKGLVEGTMSVLLGQHLYR